MQQDAWRKPGHVALAAAGALLCAFSELATAQGAAPPTVQSYPTRPIRLIIAFPPGGGNDIIARFVGTRLTNRVGQQLVIDNRGGASGIIGTEIAARAAPDGYTLLFTSVTHTMNESIRKLPYDTIKSFGGELFKRAAGINLTHVPYKGGGPASLAVIAGQSAFICVYPRLNPKG